MTDATPALSESPPSTIPSEQPGAAIPEAIPKPSLAPDGTCPPPQPSEALQLARYQALLTMITSDGALIWARYTAMLTANTIIAVILGAIAAKSEFRAADAIVALLTSVFGFGLCLLWKLLTRHGWDLQHFWVAEAHKFDWKGLQSPLEPYYQWCQTLGDQTGSKDRLGGYAQGTINLFIIFYCIIAAAAILRVLYEGDSP